MREREKERERERQRCLCIAYRCAHNVHDATETDVSLAHVHAHPFSGWLRVCMSPVIRLRSRTDRAACIHVHGMHNKAKMRHVWRVPLDSLLISDTGCFVDFQTVRVPFRYIVNSAVNWHSPS